jgi:putative tricarboxylic transport membrane protein
MDGCPMTRKGRGGHALTYAPVASSVGGVIGLILLVSLAPVLADAASNLGSPELAAVASFGIVLLAFASNGSTIVASVIGFAGVLLGTIGFDTLTDAQRMTFDRPVLRSGLNPIPVISDRSGWPRSRGTRRPSGRRHEPSRLWERGPCRCAP